MHTQSVGRFLAATLALAALSACGQPDSPKYEPQILPWAYQYHGPGKYDGQMGEVYFPGTPTPASETGPDMTPGERANYCAIHVEAEPDSAAKSKFLADLAATWKRDINNTGLDRPFGLKFSFSERHAMLSGALFEPDETIDFDRVLVSKPLADGRYKDFRIVELPANNNAGAAAFAAAFMPGAKGRPNQALFMTARKYWRYGQSDHIRTPDAIFAHDKDNELSVRLWIYPVKN